MEIQRYTPSIIWIRDPQRPAVQRSPPVDSTNTDAIEERIKKLPVVRTEKLARAGELLREPDYPARETMEGLAVLLAAELAESSRHLDRSD